MSHMLAKQRWMLNVLSTPLLILYTSFPLISRFQKVNSSVKFPLWPVSILKLCLYWMTFRAVWRLPFFPMWNRILHSAHIVDDSSETVFCSFPFSACEDKSLVWDLSSSHILGRLKSNETYKQEVCWRESSLRQFVVMFTENQELAWAKSSGDLWVWSSNLPGAREDVKLLTWIFFLSLKL